MEGSTEGKNRGGAATKVFPGLSGVDPEFPTQEVGKGLLCWPKHLVKGCVIKTATHATFEHVFGQHSICTSEYMHYLLRNGYHQHPQYASLILMDANRDWLINYALSGQVAWLDWGGNF